VSTLDVVYVLFQQTAGHELYVTVTRIALL
jgi:hypothetical protein